MLVARGSLDFFRATDILITNYFARVLARLSLGFLRCCVLRVHAGRAFTQFDGAAISPQRLPLFCTNGAVGVMLQITLRQESL